MPPRPISSRTKNRPSKVWPGATFNGGAIGLPSLSSSKHRGREPTDRAARPLARALRQRGVDVVIGLVDTHGRPETEALQDGLEILPRRKEEYRGIVVEDLDLDAVLARAPPVAIVDEIAHTNIPGSKNKKRYQDVIDLLDAGVNVIGAMNVQHLDSLKGLVQRSIGVVVREIVPDGFLRQAAQIVRDRLAPDRGRVMVCMSSYPPHAATLLRRGSRAAGRLRTDWFVVYVETPREAPSNIDSEAQRHLHANIELARELGAVVVRIKGKDPVAAIIDFARSHRIGLIIVGRSHRPWYRQLFGRSVPFRLLRQAGEFDVHIAAMPEERRPT